MEHNGVMRPLEQLRKTKGISYDVARTSSEGEVTAEAGGGEDRSEDKAGACAACFQCVRNGASD